MTSFRRPLLVVVVGLPGSGKTVYAQGLEAALAGIKFCPDDWMEALGFDLWDETARARIEHLQAGVASEVLRTGGVAIVEWGTWSRAERDALRNLARAAGAAAELHVLDPPLGVLWARVQERAREKPAITLAQLTRWFEAFERPTPEELELFDRSVLPDRPQAEPEQLLDRRTDRE